jgi:hypothetical protein
MADHAKVFISLCWCNPFFQMEDNSTLPRINNLEQSLQGRERSMLKIAADELKELAGSIVEAFSDALSEHMKGLARGNAFLQRSRLPQAANVRVLPATKEWPSTAVMTQHSLERRLGLVGVLQMFIFHLFANILSTLSFL